MKKAYNADMIKTSLQVYSILYNSRNTYAYMLCNASKYLHIENISNLNNKTYKHFVTLSDNFIQF